MTRETVEEILASHADGNASCDRVLSYVTDDGPCTVEAMLHAVRKDTRLVLYLHSDFSVIQIASGGTYDGEARYAVYWYDHLADRWDRRDPEMWTLEPSHEVEDVLEERHPHVLHVEDSELICERSPWHRTEDHIGRLEAGPEPRP